MKRDDKMFLIMIAIIVAIIVINLIAVSPLARFISQLWATALFIMALFTWISKRFIMKEYGVTFVKTKKSPEDIDTPEDITCMATNKRQAFNILTDQCSNNIKDSGHGMLFWVKIFGYKKSVKFK